MNQLWLAFITGLTAGGLSCIALQGGLLASVIIDEENEYLEDKKHESPPKARPIIFFLGSKIFVYTILGFFLGLLGAFVSLSPHVRGWLQIAIGIFIAGVALHILKVHPIFRYFSLQPPKSIRKYIRKQTKNKGDLGAAFMGLLTVFLPCAVTQTVMLIAVSSGSGLSGAGIMFAFILGTVPVFFILGYTATTLSERLNKVFLKVVAGLVLLTAIFSVTTGATLAGISLPHVSLGNDGNNENCTGESCPVSNDDTETASEMKDGVQTVVISVTDYGYTPHAIKLKKGIPAKIILKTQGTNGCSRAFVMPSYGIQKILQRDGEETLEFTPDKTGKIPFSCSMGMYEGNFEVTE